MANKMNKKIETPKDFKGAFKKILKAIGRYKLAVIVVVVFAILSTVFSVVGPKILGDATTTLADGIMNKISGKGGIDFDTIGMILLSALALYIVSGIFSLIQGWIMTGVTQKICYGLRKDISIKMNKMPMEYFESRPYGDVLSTITNDIDTLGQGLNQGLTQIITSVTTIIGVMVMMITISPLMTIIALITLPLSIFLIAIVVKFSQKYFRKQQEYLGKINGIVEETYGGHLIVKAFNKEDDIMEDFTKYGDVLYDSAKKSQFLSGLMQPLMLFVGNLGYVAVVIAGAFLAIKGKIGIGGIQAFIQYVKSFNQPLQQIAQVATQIQATAAAAERVYEFLDEEEFIDIEETDDVKNIKNIKGSVSFENVTFGYDSNVPIIKNFSLDVKPGQKVAIVGPTGAGKTTLVKLLLRFYEVNQGKITLDGIDERDFQRRHLREFYGMVLQDTWLFNGTIMENIRYGSPNATDEEVINAAKAAHADHFIRTLPNGYNMEINEDATNISQGQKQLLTIARAILADNKIMILDEATSSVDTRTEALIQNAMDTLMTGRTSFVIAHRLSTIKNADIILMMKDGDIVEQGTHKELLAKGGAYYELYNSQF